MNLISLTEALLPSVIVAYDDVPNQAVAAPEAFRSVSEGQTTVVVEGTMGLPGRRGLSSYEIAVIEGFTGTEKEWLDSLKGVGALSNDEGNNIKFGGDGGLYVPDDITADPLAYYILSRS